MTATEPGDAAFVVVDVTPDMTDEECGQVAKQLIAGLMKRANDPLAPPS